MNDDLIKLAIIQGCIGLLEPPQQTEVANLVDEIQAVLKTASDERVAAAAIALVSAMNLVAIKEPN